MKYGELTVIGPTESRRFVIVLCDCGVEKRVRTTDLRRGFTRSCGCTSRKRCAEKIRSHGQSNAAIYRSWSQMIQRCTNASLKSFANYGARGISVCARWRIFENFLSDMGERPAGLTLDRIDVNGNYEPGNCRWATRTVQARNTRANKLNESKAADIRARVAAGGTFEAVAAEFGVSDSMVDHIVHGRAWV